MTMIVDLVMVEKINGRMSLLLQQLQGTSRGGPVLPA